MLNKKAKSHKKPVRSYYCDVCCGWHVTSIPKWRGEKDAEMTEKRNLTIIITKDLENPNNSVIFAE